LKQLFKKKEAGVHSGVLHVMPRIALELTQPLLEGSPRLRLALWRWWGWTTDVLVHKHGVGRDLGLLVNLSDKKSLSRAIATPTTTASHKPIDIGVDARGGGVVHVVTVSTKV